MDQIIEEGRLSLLQRYCGRESMLSEYYSCKTCTYKTIYLLAIQGWS